MTASFKKHHKHYKKNIIIYNSDTVLQVHYYVLYTIGR